MNDVFSELWQQAVSEVNIIYRQIDQEQEIEFDADIWFTNQTRARFGELIAITCSDICLNKNVSNLDLSVAAESGKFTVQDLATRSCGKNLSQYIKHYFGVDE